MTLHELAGLVSMMRAAAEAFLRTGDLADLNRSRILEGRVDQAVRDVFAQPADAKEGCEVTEEALKGQACELCLDPAPASLAAVATPETDTARRTVRLCPSCRELVDRLRKLDDRPPLAVVEPEKEGK